MTCSSRKCKVLGQKIKSWTKCQYLLVLLFCVCFQFLWRSISLRCWWQGPASARWRGKDFTWQFNCSALLSINKFSSLSYFFSVEKTCKEWIGVVVPQSSEAVLGVSQVPHGSLSSVVIHLTCRAMRAGDITIRDVPVDMHTESVNCHCLV